MKAGILIFLLIILPVLFAANTFAQGKIRIVVSVDWEGRDLNPENLRAMQDFRRDFPDIPFELFRRESNPNILQLTVGHFLFKGKICRPSKNKTAQPDSTSN